MSRPVLFYSPNCKYSIELWNKLKQSKKLNMIIKINVNKTKNIPKNIQSVPTLLVKGRPLLTGNSIELFLNSYSENVNVNNVLDLVRGRILLAQCGTWTATRMRLWGSRPSTLEADSCLEARGPRASNSRSPQRSCWDKSPPNPGMVVIYFLATVHSFLWIPW